MVISSCILECVLIELVLAKTVSQHPKMIPQVWWITFFCGLAMVAATEAGAVDLDLAPPLS